MEGTLNSMLEGAEGMMNSMTEGIESGAINMPDTAQLESAMNGLLESAAPTVVGLAAGALITALVAVAIYVLFAIGMWKMFKKAGEKGWASIIPIYNIYILAKIAGLKPWIGLIAALISIIPTVGPILSVICLAFIFYYISLSYGKSPAFTIGLVLLPPIFTMILGFGSAKYQEPSAAKVKGIGKDA